MMSRGFAALARASLLIGGLAAYALVQATEFEYLGEFHNVVSDDGEHCNGYSLELWRDGAAVFGLFNVHAGLCGDPPCGVVRDVVLDRKTGRIEFSTSVRATAYRFAGTLTPASVAGSLNGKRVDLQRNLDALGKDFAPNQSRTAWCGLWSKITRCEGVKELCAAPPGKK